MSEVSAAIEALRHRVRRVMDKYEVEEKYVPLEAPIEGDDPWALAAAHGSTMLVARVAVGSTGSLVCFHSVLGYSVPDTTLLAQFVAQHEPTFHYGKFQLWPDGDGIVMPRLRYVLDADVTDDEGLEKVADYILETALSLGPELVEQCGGSTFEEAINGAVPRPAPPMRPAAVLPVHTESPSLMADEFDHKQFCANLNVKILGQDKIIEEIGDRLVVTRKGLDSREHRPDGVFLFAGPTGTGKTALALAMAEEIYGSEDAVIRLDMSEYHDTHTAANLIGAPPGYMGSNNPDPWLTTRINKKPNTVLILDEIEKAHPKVWDTFLQVFDVGRLTDQQGGTANFENVVIIMTTNIGAENFRIDPSSPGIDYGVDQRVAAVQADIKGQMRPEFINRMDAILVFRPLSHEVVWSIAEKQLGQALERLNSKGWTVTADPSVVDVIATLGYQPEHGARPIHRTVEKHVTTALAKQGQGTYRLTAKDGNIVVT